MAKFPVDVPIERAIKALKCLGFILLQSGIPRDKFLKVYEEL